MMGKKTRPVIIHRAMLGSFERMIAILIEHFQGKFPAWLSPRQLMIIPVANKPDLVEYCDKVKMQAIQEGLKYVDIDSSSDTFNYRIKQAELLYYANVIIIGKKELENNTVTFRVIDNVRKDNTVHFNFFVDQMSF